MPLPPERRATLARAIADAIGADKVIADDYSLRLYQYDAGVDTALPDLVLLPASSDDIATAMEKCLAEGVPVVPRGAGTGLAGGALAAEGGMVISFARLNRVLAIDPDNRRAVVQPGLINLHLSAATAADRLFFAPDPSSQRASTIGGNIGNNAGGPHTLLYGVTVNHVTGVELITGAGERVRLGGAVADPVGYDLVGLVVGAEGTAGVVTEATVNLTPLPESVKTMLVVFNSISDASAAVSAIIGAGIIPAALEMIDRIIIQAVEDAYHAGYPRDAEAVLLVELEGLADGQDEDAAAIVELCRGCGATDLKVAQTAHERELLWLGRKAAAGAVGRITPEYYLMDGVIPRSRLPEVMEKIQAIGARYNTVVANVFHAGDGNLHPLVPFDGRVPGALKRAIEATVEIMQVVIDVGGTLSGEHGIGLEKNNYMGLIFSEADLEVMQRVRRAFDPDLRMNPGKVFPNPGRCLEIATPAAPGGII
ncbi:MAG TPA: FAD-linked oxidase C-terminal domain-containing protein [Dehalococcoidia bacterium]|nr:FAD-linked oxidase C-terminal domain-containing protein [Dehalococcoidia bacterium]